MGFMVASFLFSSAVALDACWNWGGDDTSTCDDGNTCISQHWKYDGEIDCKDASDEGGWTAVHTEKIAQDMDVLKAKLDGIVTQLSG